MIDNRLFFVDERLSTMNDGLLVIMIFLSLVIWKEIEVGLSNEAVRMLRRRPGRSRSPRVGDV